MNNILFKYLLKNFLKTFLVVLTIIYCFGIILNLFEEIEFFKNSNANFITPLMLTGIFVPSLIINIMPFVIFFSSMIFMIKIRNNKDLLALKVYGYSNVKIFFILASTSFMLGWFVLFIINPITSSMAKYYEMTKSKYARDIDHLVTYNKNGLWIKENIGNTERIITASRPDGENLIDVTIFQFNNNYDFNKKILAKNANIKSTNWVLNDVIIYELIDGVFVKKVIENFEIISNYNHKKINNLFNNSDTISFLELLSDYKNMLNNGYSKAFLNESLHTRLVLPFFLFLMTALASVLTMHTLKKSDNFKFIIVGLIVSILIYYLKDLSIALGKTDRIPLIISIWVPVITLFFLNIVGVLQINEK
jgi:lipopolysaccharide export system permease protein